MPDLMEHMYCAQQINIPPNLPFILKQYAKAAIRTQPYDLLHWSAAYFRAKANNSPPPVKERLEYPPANTPSRLSPGFLKVLHKQLGENEFVTVNFLYEKWLGVCLVKEALDSMLKVGNIDDKVPWLQFVGIAAGYLCPSLRKTMVMVCEVLTEEPEGGSAMVPVDVFVNLYQFLARLDCGSQSEHVLVAAETAETISSHETESSIVDDVKKESFGEGVVSEKDSHAGLMVWEDLKPEDQVDIVKSPKYTEEPGAASETGLEVLDDAKGIATEVLTLFPVQQESDIPVSSSTPHIEPSQVKYETTLSHSSLKENEDWIKLESQKVEVPMDSSKEDDSGIVDVSKAVTTMSEAYDSEQTLRSQSGPVSSEIQEDDDFKSEEKMSPETDIKENQPSTTVTEEKPTSDTEKSINGEKHSLQSSELDLEQGEPRLSEESVFEPEESITVQHFIRNDIDGSTISYSTAEIRKGFLGNQPGDKIDRDSSENTVRAAETVPNFKDSSEFITHEKETEQQLKRLQSPSDKYSQSESLSYDKLPEEKFRQHVPGIGPVIPEPQVLAVVEYMQYWAAKQEGMVMPRNINHILCPPLDLPPSEELNNEFQF